MRNRTCSIGALLLVAACAPEPIEWRPAQDMAGTIGATTRLTMEENGTPRLVDQPAPAVVLPPAGCATSVVAARARGEEWYAAWFLARFDSSVVLMVTRSVDGGSTWSTPVVADGRDRGRRGCSRPRPALTADAASAYVHAAYFIEPIEGAGVWYTHSMEQGTIWHQTIGVLYGDEPVTASIASAGETVLVAYEHPGSGGSRLGVAISRQAGHTFAERLRVVRVSGAAREPRIALRDGRVALAWLEQPRSTGGATPAARARVQVGDLR
ncbi:MAG TPA: sialidase family protein [Gemmatimonadaceae bacterium]|nr:sialidase family protein [Gemmatimonadaceae bacterium]